MKYRVEYFKPTEFDCPCCHSGGVSALLVYELDLFRRAWASPVRVNSGYRCFQHNKDVGGAQPSAISAGSRHLIGCAADIAPTDPKLIGPFQNLAALMFGKRDGYELKLYPTFVHIAVPRTEATHTWTGNHVFIEGR